MSDDKCERIIHSFWSSFREWVVIIVNKSTSYKTLDVFGKRIGSFIGIDLKVTEHKEVVFERLENFYCSTLIPPLFQDSFHQQMQSFIKHIKF